MRLPTVSWLSLVFLLNSTVAFGQSIQNGKIETVAGTDSAGVPATSFSIGMVGDLAADSKGNTYFVWQAVSRVYRIGPDGVVSIFAGNGVWGESRDGVPAVASPLLNPYNLAVDPSGDVWLVSYPKLVRVDVTSGLMHTVLTLPYRQPGSAVSLGSIGSMFFGAEGTLYLADGSDHRLKRFSPSSGVVEILAGNGQYGQAMPGETALSSPLAYPGSVALAPDGSMFFSNLESGIFRVDTQTGVVSKFDPVVKSETLRFDIPHDMVFDRSGNLYFLIRNRGQVIRLAWESLLDAIESGSPESDVEGIIMNPTSLLFGWSMTLDGGGNPLVAEAYRIRKVDASSGILSTIAGNGLAAYNGDGISALDVQLWEPAHVLPAADGELYVTSSFSNRVLRVAEDGSVTTAAGGGPQSSGFSVARPGAIALLFPQGIWRDDIGDLYFSDQDNLVVRRLSAHTGMVDNVATTTRESFTAYIHLFFAASLVATDEYFYLSDPSGSRVWRISRVDNAVEPYVGTGVRGFSGDSAAASTAQLRYPCGLALDNSGNLYIADSDYVEHGPGRIRRVDAATGEINTVLSNLQQPSGLAFASPGILCFVESAGNRVSCLDLATKKVTRIAGNGVAGFDGDHGSATDAQLNRPSGIAFDHRGNLYIADTGNQRVRRVRF